MRDETRPSRVAPFRQDQIDRVTGRVLGQPAADQHLELLILLAADLKGDLVTASEYANLDISDTHPLNLLARALLAARNGDRGRAGETMDRLNSLYPKWRDSPRRELQKFIPSTETVDRRTHDLAAVGLGAPK